MISKTLARHLERAFGTSDAAALDALVQAAGGGKDAGRDLATRFAHFLCVLDESLSQAECRAASGGVDAQDARTPPGVDQNARRGGTGPKDVEQALREAQASAAAAHGALRALLEALPNPVFVKDEHHRYIELNESFAQLRGHSRDAMIDRADAEFATPEQLASFRTSDNAVMTSGKISVREERYVTPTGETRHLFTSKSPAKLPDGRRIIVGNITDVTKLKEAQAELEAARDAAERASQAKSEFLAKMSHEIRTPMNGVLGLTDLLSETQLSETQRRYTENIRASAEALVAIINDILDFSKIEAGKLNLDPAPFDVHDEVESATEVLAARAHARGLDLSSFIEGAVPCNVVGDRGRLRQVLLNLIGNAVKFTERGEVGLTVRRVRQRVGSESLRIRFSVHDTGIGVPSELRERLFQPFMQADGSTTRRFGGSGLGLAISRQLVSMMGGDIGVESSPGTGSIFWVELPFEAGAREAVEQPAKPFEGSRALIVQPHPTQAVILKHYLQELGLQPEWVVDCHDAPVRLQSAAREGRPFQVVLIDPRTTTGHPSDVVQRLSERVSPVDARLVLISSAVGGWEADEARRAGFAAVVRKPLRRRDLREAVTSALARSDASLPADHSASGPTSAPAASLAAPVAALSLRVLLVEDNPINQFIARVILEQMKCSVTVAEDGLQGLKSYQNGHFDIVLMDCQMPRLDGYTATREIREFEAANPVRPRVPVVALTANAMPGDREKCLDAGMDDYLAKPFTKKQLAEVIARWIRLKPEPTTMPLCGL